MGKQHYFHNKCILITGGSSGIGYALAKKLVQYRPRSVVLLSHERTKLSEAADYLRATAGHVQTGFCVADVSSSDDVKRACNEVMIGFGVPDILINNAGYAHYDLFHDMLLEEVIRHVDVNLLGAMRMTHAFLPAMRARKSGQIVNMASVAGHMLIIPSLAYGAAKHGMVAWSEGLALELAADNIAVQVISPGRVLTDFFRHDSFQKRTAGKETRLMVSMEKVVNVSVDAIVRRKKQVIVPGFWAWISWSLRACPWLIKPLYHSILKKRIGRIRCNPPC